MQGKRESPRGGEGKRSGGLDVAGRTSEELSKLRRIQQLAKTPSHLCQKEKEQSHAYKLKDREKGENHGGKRTAPCRERKWSKQEDEERVSFIMKESGF